MSSLRCNLWILLDVFILVLQLWRVSQGSPRGVAVRPELVEGEGNFFKIRGLDFTCPWFDRLTTNGDRLARFVTSAQAGVQWGLG